ncbi:hypothetical protein Mapa_010013 [Marchantia paleacea]|nr:hypothetical protein Mapa_010013 [Marchantia paleacea]
MDGAKSLIIYIPVQYQGTSALHCTVVDLPHPLHLEIYHVPCSTGENVKLMVGFFLGIRLELTNKHYLNAISLR